MILRLSSYISDPHSGKETNGNVHKTKWSRALEWFQKFGFQGFAPAVWAVHEPYQLGSYFKYVKKNLFFGYKGTVPCKLYLHFFKPTHWTSRTSCPLRKQKRWNRSHDDCGDFSCWRLPLGPKGSRYFSCRGLFDHSGHLLHTLFLMGDKQSGALFHHTSSISERCYLRSLDFGKLFHMQTTGVIILTDI